MAWREFVLVFGGQGRKMGAAAPTLFGAIKLLVNNRTAISEWF